MHTFVEKMKIEKVIDKTFCNSCGKEPCFVPSPEWANITWECEIKINYSVCGPFPGQHNGTIKYHICKECFNERFTKLFVLAPNKEEFKYLD